MVNIVLISHGEFCEGLLKSLKMVTGDDFGIRTVPLFPGETVETYRRKLEETLEEVKSEQGTLILADIMFGTPFQSAAYAAKKYKAGVVTGMNMPLLVAMAAERTEATTLEELVEKAADPKLHGISGTTFKEGAKKRRGKLSINKD